MKRCCSILLLLFLAACGARVDPRPAFADLSKTIGSRSGARPGWARTPEETEALEQRVRELIGAELTVEAAVQIALINNRSLQADFEDLAVAQADLAQAGLVRNPEFHFSARFPDVPPSPANLEFALGIDLLDFLVLPARKKIALADFEATRLRLGAEMLDLVAEVKSAFYTLAAQTELVGRLEVVSEINEAARELAQRQFEAGTIGELDLANHDAVYQQSRIELAKARLGERVERERLNRLLGLWGPDASWTARRGLPPLPAEEVPVQQLESHAMRERLDLEAARWTVNLFARALALKKKTRFFPVGIEVGVDGERETEGQWITGPTLALQIPIFDTGKADVARLEAQLLQAQRRREALAVEARSRVREARDLMLAARDLATFYHQHVIPQRERIVDLTLRQYNMMLKGAYDLLAAKENAVGDERAYLEAWRDYWIARAELERAVGGQLPDPERTLQP